jgi:GYF domain 2
MSNRSWFYAANGQQQGPFPEAQLRDLIVRGTVRADTLVWSEGMSGWQRAAEIPGLMPSAGAPPSVPQPGGPPPMSADGGYGGGGGYAGGALSIDFGILEFVWRSLVLVIGMALIVPGPWVLVWYLNWLVPCVQVPGRPNLSFTGTAMTIVPWWFGFIAIVIAVAFLGSEILSNLMNLAQIVVYWLFAKWFIANLASNGQPLGLSFTGSVWAYLGYSILALLAIFTIIGWAWVYVAMMRWFCRNIQGTRREVLFIGTGLEFLWRAIVALIASVFIIPIPWVYRWIYQWIASQTVLAERGTHANG